jgi:hypothetical protein
MKTFFLRIFKDLLLSKKKFTSSFDQIPIIFNNRPKPFFPTLALLLLVVDGMISINLFTISTQTLTNERKNQIFF